MYDYKNIKISVDEKGVAQMVLARTEKANTFDVNLMEQVTAAFKELDADPNVKAVILSGEGKLFSGGADINWMASAVKGELETPEAFHERNVKDCKNFTGMLEAAHDFSKPLIGKIHGVAKGGGIGLASVCDFVVAQEGTRFSYPEIKLGIYPAMIAPYSISRIGIDNANYLFKSGVEFYATDAKKCGLVEEVVAAEHMDDYVTRLSDFASKHDKETLRGNALDRRQKNLVNIEQKQYTIEPDMNAKMDELIYGVAERLVGQHKGEGAISDFTIPFTADARATERAQRELKNMLEKLSKKDEKIMPR